MKHSNQEQTSKNQESADQHKKANKPQQGGVRRDAGNFGSQTVKGNREPQHGHENEGSNGQKGKQGSRK